MTERCWCTKTLVFTGEFRTGFLVCPVHGEEYGWRECKLAGKPYQQPGKALWRSCPTGHAAGPTDCATCPVPAALAKAALCDEMAAVIRPGADAHRGDRHETPFQRLINKYDALEASRG